MVSCVVFSLFSSHCLVVRFHERNIINANRWVKLGPIRYHTRPSPSSSILNRYRTSKLISYAHPGFLPPRSSFVIVLGFRLELCKDGDRRNENEKHEKENS
ncbi:hypothetical protein BDV38DRAFT_259467 [Aspergillus pseudotamarii]|uniref:Uncharacterized protein n=1 Tax=Aspergillus pseudotamarii TaxID=132259 RepID=A0A5N6SE87_ASPPS|nr:uncharacterized protein BDV38DRAFT_259467 [Aspergillus pseudotamarii]KAE8133036.1 hypothetical protein BDV38DRAFT_259467 [Aspergillus pseudotamarii]